MSATTASKLTRASSNGTPIASATTTTLVAAPAAGFHLRVHRVVASNASATGTWVHWRDGTAGTIYYSAFLAQGGRQNDYLDKPWNLTTATLLALTTSGAGSVEWTAEYEVVPD